MITGAAIMLVGVIVGYCLAKGSEASTEPKPHDGPGVREAV